MIRVTLAAAAALAAAPVAAQEREVAITLHPAVDRPSTTFEGWGTRARLVRSRHRRLARY